MNRREDRVPTLKKSFAVLLSLCLIIVSLYIFLNIFLKSRSFARLFEYAVSAGTGKVVEVGAVYLKRGPLVIIKDLSIKNDEDSRSFVVLPEVELGLSTSIILKRKIESLKLRDPELFLSLDDDPGTKTGGAGISFPLSLSKASIENGSVIFQLREGRSFRISEVNLLLKERNNKTEVKGSIFPDNLNSTVPVELSLNMEPLNVQKGSIEVNLNASLSSPVFDSLSMVGVISIKGGLNEPLVHGILYLKGKGIKKGGLDVGSFRASLPFRYKNGLFAIRKAEMRSGYAKLLREENYNGTLDKLELLIPALEYKDSVARADDVELRADKAVISKGGNEFYTEEGISLLASLTMNVSKEAVHGVGGRVDMNIYKGNFSSPDGYIACEGIEMGIRSDFEFNIPVSEAEFAIQAEATGFELLAGRFYGSFNDRNLTASLKGSYSGAEDAIKVFETDLGLTDVGTIRAFGEITDISGPLRFDTTVSVEKLSNDKAFNFFLRETFQESLPILSQLDVGGVTSMKLSVNGTKEAFIANGSIAASDVHIADKVSDLSIQGLNILLPLDISYPDKIYSKEVTAGSGSLTVQGISWGDLHIKDLRILPSIRQNALILEGDITIPVFKGLVTVKDFKFDDILSSKRNLELSVQIDSVDLNEVSRALKIPRFSGSLSGYIPKAGLEGNSIVSEGEIIMELFGGKIKLSDLSINNIFSLIPSLKTSIYIDEIDLAELTNTFETGHISGTMQGYVKNLVITDGQAESFDASISTVPRKGGKQQISVEALKKISVLGGSPASVLNSGLYRLFKEYGYEKIGFKGSLRNDNFLLLGIESKGERQYIVKGGLLPPKVDVINYTQNVSFQEMLKRLKRVKQIK
jgi:hypothetical protein